MYNRSLLLIGVAIFDLASNWEMQRLLLGFDTPSYMI